MPTLANDYYLRDIEMDLDPYDIIMFSLKKLGYYNINKPLLCRENIKRHLNKLINSNSLDYTKTLQYYINKYKQSSEYKKFVNQINIKIGRSIVLQKYLNDSNNHDFYINCTEDELIYIGF
jgi:hypothetical protein